MKLKLATVKSSSASDCRVRWLDDADDIDAVYSQPMRDCGIRGQSLDLVAVNCESEQVQIVYRYDIVKEKRDEFNNCESTDL